MRFRRMCSFVADSTDLLYNNFVNQNKKFSLKASKSAVELEMSPQSVTHSDDTSMCIATVAMLSVQIHSVDWMVDSKAGMSGCADNSIDRMSYGTHSTPAFRSVLKATPKDAISHRTLIDLGVRAIRIDGMHYNLLSAH